MVNSLDCHPAMSNFGSDLSSALVSIILILIWSVTRVAEAHTVIFPCTPSPFCIIPNFCSPSFCPLFYIFLLSLPSLCLLVPCECGQCPAVAAAGGLPDVSLCRTGPRGLLLKRGSVLHLQIALHNHFLLPTHSSQAALCAKAEKSANRGVQSNQGLSTGRYSSSPQCSSLLLPYQPQDGFILKFTNIPFSEAWRSTGHSFPPFIGAWQTSRVSAALRLERWNLLVLSICMMSVWLAKPHLWHLSCYIRREREEQGS